MTSEMWSMQRPSLACAPAVRQVASDNDASGLMTDELGPIPEDRRRHFAEVLARILVTRALLALGIHPSINE